MTHSLARLSVALAAVLLLGHEQAGAVRIAQPGVVVEDVSKGSAGEQAGILPGDVLLGWQRPPSSPANPEKAEGSIESVFHWMWVDMEQGPRGSVRVRGQRNGKETNFEVPIGNWGVTVHPRLEEHALNVYTEGRSILAAGRFDKGIALWNTLARSAESTHDMETASWISLRIGDEWVEVGRWREAQNAYQTALAAAAKAGIAIAQPLIWDSIGRAFQSESKFDDGEKAFESARADREKAGGESLSTARSLNDLGRLKLYRGDLVPAEGDLLRAISIQEKQAPDSLDLARSFNNLGNVYWVRGVLDKAEGYHTRALAIRDQLAPDGLEVAGSLNNLGNIARDRGDLAAAETLYTRGLKIQLTVASNSIEPAGSLNNLGRVAEDRGDLATAEDYYKRSLAIEEKFAPDDGLSLAGLLTNLGNVASSRGELAAAEHYYRRALAIYETLMPEGLGVATALHNIGNQRTRSGDLATAYAYHERALAIRERLAPDSIQVASSLSNIGNVARDRNDLATAEAYYARGVAIQERLAPNSVDLASYLGRWGNVALRRENLAQAEALHKRALAIRQNLSPGSLAEASSLYDLGVLYWKTNQTALAADHLRGAIGALEAQVGRLGGTQEAQSSFGTGYVDYYRDYIAFLVEQNQAADAFHILERSRARTLLTMLGERDLVFTADVPEDIERERKRIAWEYDQAQATLARLNPVREQAQVDTALAHIRELRERQSEIVARIRQQSPRLAALQYPQALDVNGVRATLDPGTLVLSYSIGKEKSYLFALAPEASVQVYPLAIGETQLRADVERFRGLIQRAALGTTDLTGIVERGRRLYDVLMRPVAPALARATRVLVVPDGPLHALPFAALARGVEASATRGRDWQYLVEWKAVHVVVSATVYAELRKARQNRGVTASQRTLIAFGDPRYPAITVGADKAELDGPDPVVRSMLTRGYRLTPLPATKREVAAIASLYRATAETYVGDAATEERAKGVARETRYLHFASHGLLDERFPLNSGLALTIPAQVKEGQDNGILQAWEIFERLRIDADLVVLSACETGLGKEMGGEGLVGLTRAFHYAGARSVLASLWSVADDTTATLMTRFYGYLKTGRSKDAALRQAQLDLIRGGAGHREPNAQAGKADAAHPFYWAAFQLNGDWR